MKDLVKIHVEPERSLKIVDSVLIISVVGDSNQNVGELSRLMICQEKEDKKKKGDDDEISTLCQRIEGIRKGSALPRGASGKR